MRFSIKTLLHRLVPLLPNWLQIKISSTLYYAQNSLYSLVPKSGLLPVQSITSQKIKKCIVVTAFFDPHQSPILYQNYQKFWHKLQLQGIELCTVELAFGNQKHQLQFTDASKLIQVRSQSILWQKEALYNLAAKQLSLQYDALIFLDADVYFANNDWVEKTLAALQTYAIVQPFSMLVRLPAHTEVLSPQEVSFGMLDGQKIASCASVVSRLGTGSLPHPFVRGSVGIGLAVRTEVLQKCQLYDAMIVGGGDHINLFAAYNTYPYFYDWLSNSHKAHILQWQKKWSQLINMSIGAVHQTVYHYYHGSHLGKNKRNRQYILANHQFNPLLDVVKNPDGAWEWSSDNIALQKSVEHYFVMREINTN